jgi:hypothetical protein
MLTYEPYLPWQDFAMKTIATDDLDPVYVALYRSGMSEAKLMRWCAAFVTYYHMGTACELCELEGSDFWHKLWMVYDTAPRASERRHFRGQAGRKAIRWWAVEYKTPEAFFAACMQPSFMKLLNKGIPQIGTYFTWKCMDLREAVFGYHVDWTNAEKHLVTLPTQGMQVIFPELAEQAKPDYAAALHRVADEIKYLMAPPRGVRSCGIAEAETVCCMAKSYYKNRKPIGKDIVEKRADLQGYGDVADLILSHMPEEPFDTEIVE